MSTNKQRREVAARLRVLADENTVTATPSFNHTLFAALGGEPPAPPSMPTLGDLEAYDKALLYRLADLIEPEPERTCEAKQDYDAMEDGVPDCRIWRCSCGEAFPYWRGCNPIFCPECGAKIIHGTEGDE